MSDSASEGNMPKGDFTGKAFDVLVSFDSLIASIYTALIAGTVLLMLKEKLPEWVGACFMLGLVCFVLGLGHTLLHISYASKLLFLMAAFDSGAERVPNAVEADEPTEEAFGRLRGNAQRAFSAQLFYLLFGVCFAAAALFVQLWHYAWRASLAVLLIASLTLAAGLVMVTWRDRIVGYGRRWRSSG